MVQILYRVGYETSGTLAIAGLVFLPGLFDEETPAAIFPRGNSLFDAALLGGTRAAEALREGVGMAVPTTGLPRRLFARIGNGRCETNRQEESLVQQARQIVETTRRAVESREQLVEAAGEEVQRCERVLATARGRLEAAEERLAGTVKPSAGVTPGRDRWPLAPRPPVPRPPPGDDYERLIRLRRAAAERGWSDGETDWSAVETLKDAFHRARNASSHEIVHSRDIDDPWDNWVIGRDGQPVRRSVIGRQHNDADIATRNRNAAARDVARAEISLSEARAAHLEHQEQLVRLESDLAAAEQQLSGLLVLGESVFEWHEGVLDVAEGTHLLFVERRMDGTSDRLSATLIRVRAGAARRRIAVPSGGAVEGRFEVLDACSTSAGSRLTEASSHLLGLVGEVPGLPVTVLCPAFHESGFAEERSWLSGATRRQVRQAGLDLGDDRDGDGKGSSAGGRARPQKVPALSLTP